jgi:hypothetical protein
MIRAAAIGASDVVESAWKIFGRRQKGDRFNGEIPSAEFFDAAHRGSPSALRSMADLGYGGVWENNIGKRAGIQREIAARRFWKPRGMLTGSSIYGMNRAKQTLRSGVGPLAQAFAAVDVATSIATAPRGELVSKVSSSLGGNIGALAGSVVGAAMLGLPGEVVGTMIGYELGSLPGKALAKVRTLGKNARRVHVGGDFQDTEAMATMRRRAASELSTSLLNARQYLGREAVLFHQ